MGRHRTVEGRYFANFRHDSTLRRPRRSAPARSQPRRGCGRRARGRRRHRRRPVRCWPRDPAELAGGQAAIDLAPPQVKDFAISAFGTDDKTALLGGILVILALYAAVVGMLAVRRLAFGMWGLAIFAAIGLAAALTRPTATAGYVVPTLVGAAAGAIALTWLARTAAGLGSPPAVRPHPAAAGGALAPPDIPPS